MKNPFEKHLCERINAIRPGLFESLPHIQTMPINEGLAALAILLEHACIAQNAGVMKTARNAINLIPKDWLIDHLIQAAQTTLNIDDEWEFLRLLEITRDFCPGLLYELINIGATSSIVEIREVACNFKLSAKENSE